MAEPVLNQRDAIQNIRTFPSLIKFLRDELEWPIESDDFEELTFDYTPEELGIDTENAAKIQEIKRLRPLSAGQPWGIFFVKFEPKRLPVVALRRILSRVVLKKRASANSADRAAWQADDLLFISNYGEGAERQISFAHFSQDGQKTDLPTLKVLGWDNRDTPLHLDDVADTLHQKLAWPEDDKNAKRWREQWRSAFTLRHLEVITTSKDLAVRLADLARAIRDRIQTVLEIETESGPLTKLMKAFQQALIHDLSADDFADMYAQTIAYGLLSARVANPAHDTADAVATHIPVTNPFLKELMETFLHLGGRKRKERGGDGIDFDELGVSEVVELLDAANMEAVVRDFGDRNRDEDPVIHFYELFLKEYDAKKRMQRGVFYTPQPVVSYIVRSVHELLQAEFGLEDGLASTATWGDMAAKNAGLRIPDGANPADPFVVILDPATGTATFLVEVIDLIHRTLAAKWKNQRLTDAQQHASWNAYVPKHLLPRLHGYELLMAPYAIAHMKIGLKLYETGYRFGSDERARIYLTNALEPASDDKKQREFEEWAPALAHEARAVNAIKRHQRFTVVIGNPPYSNFGQLNKIPFILDLLDDYKRGLDERKINLDDDFIKFIRYGQNQLQITGIGVLGFITNNVFLDGITHRRMRQSLLECFNLLKFVDLHGSIQKRELAPDGTADENVFDIKQGVAVSVLARTLQAAHHPVSLIDLYGKRSSKYERLSNARRQIASPSEMTPNPPQFFFKASANPYRIEYESGWSVPVMMPFYNSGIQTKKDLLTIHYTEADLQHTISELKKRDAEWLRTHYDLGPDGRDWAVKWAKEDVMKSAGRVFRLQYRPFDFRYSYFTGTSKGFIAYPRKELTECLLTKNLALATMRQVAGVPDECEVFATTVPMTDRSMCSTLGTPYLFPLYCGTGVRDLLVASHRRPNFSGDFLTALALALKLRRQGEFDLPNGLAPEDIFYYAYAVFHSPGYRSRYTEFLKIDFPRLPLTGNLELFRSLGRLGGELVSLHLLESPKLDKFITTYSGPPIPEVEKISHAHDTVWLDKEQTRGFHGVADAVWHLHIGGYQISERWLKERKGRTLSKDDITHYHKIVVALSETIRLMTEIDEVIERYGGWPGAFADTTLERAEEKSEAES